MKRRYGLGAALLLVALLSPRLARGYRPFDGTDAGVAEPHELELEMGPAGYRQEGNERFLVTPALVVNYGFAPGFEAVLEGRNRLSLGVPRYRSRVDDLALSVKSVLREGSLQGKQGLSVAVESGLLWPSAEERFGAHVASIFSLSWPELALHLNLSNDLLFSLHYVASAGLIIEGPAAWRVRPVAEALLARDFGTVSGDGGTGESLLVGAIAPCGSAVALDAAVRYGRAGGTHDEEARLGLTWAFDVR